MNEDLKQRFNYSLNELRNEMDDLLRFCDNSNDLSSELSSAEIHRLINQVISTKQELVKIHNWQQRRTD